MTFIVSIIYMDFLYICFVSIYIHGDFQKSNLHAVSAYVFLANEIHPRSNIFVSVNHKFDNGLLLLHRQFFEIIFFSGSLMCVIIFEFIRVHLIFVLNPIPNINNNFQIWQIYGSSNNFIILLLIRYIFKNMTCVTT